MGGEIEADSIKLALQPFLQRPVLGVEHLQGRGTVAAVPAAAGVTTAVPGAVSSAVGRTAEQRGLRRIALLGQGDTKAGQPVDVDEQPRPVIVDAVEGTRRNQVLHNPLARCPGIDTSGEVFQPLEWPALLAFGDQLLHGRPADVLDGVERVAHGLAPGFRVVFDIKNRLGRIDIRGQQRDLEPFQIALEHGQLVGVAGIEDHRRAEEFLGEMGLQIGGLVGHQRVGRCVGLVEAVAGEGLDLGEDFQCLGFLDVVRSRAVDEGSLLLVHLGFELLTHGPAQQVGTAQRVPGQRLRRLHHLLLINHDAVGLGNDRLEQGVQVVDLLLAVLTADVGRNVLHWTRTVEGDDGDDVFEAVGTQLAQHVAHPGGFQLENAHGLGPAQHFKHLGIIQRDAVDVEIRLEAADQPLGFGDDSQGLEAEKVELDQPRRLNPFHVELGGGHIRARILVERDQFGQVTITDHHPGGVGRGVAEQAFEPLTDIEQFGDDLLGAAHLLQLLVAGDGFGQCRRGCRVIGDELGDAVGLAVGHAQHSADVADDGAGLQLAEGDDLRNPVGSVLIADVGDDLVASVLAEVDVEVGHRHPLRV